MNDVMQHSDAFALHMEKDPTLRATIVASARRAASVGGFFSHGLYLSGERGLARIKCEDKLRFTIAHQQR